ncbi:MAG TPA: methyl-accepting chemotaxis protein [Nitrospirae bacterium]|nr:methyl-accepting chemotaxis protein [Nitrospirota bacterium]
MRNRRKKINFSVKREMQLRLLLKILSIVTIGIGIMGLIFYFYSNREIGQTYRQFHVTARNFLDYLLPAVIISLVLGFVASIAITIFFPHKIAGPLYRIERDLREKVGEGDLSVRFILRKGDEVQDLADAINTTLEKLGAKIEGVNNAVERIEVAIRNKADDREIERLVKELKDALDVFKL